LRRIDPTKGAHRKGAKRVIAVSPRGRRAGDREPLHRTLDDIAQVLESADRSEERVRRALELCRRLVPYERCALLEEQPGREPRLLVVPEASPERGAFLQAALEKLVAQLVEERSLSPGALSGVPTGARGPHLAVPLMGLDRVIGVLFVHSATDAFGLRHLRALAMVASKLAAYLTMCHARSEEALQADELRSARGAASAAVRAKDEFLALASHELKAPLAAALEAVHALGASDLPEADRARAVEAVEGRLRAHSKLVDDLVDLSRIAAASGFR